MKIYLDDLRCPSDTYSDSSEWRLFRSPEEVLNFFYKNYTNITHISFDHDLNYFLSDGTEITGYTCLQSLCNFMMDNNINPSKYIFNFHTANPVGYKNMLTYWENFKNHFNS